ncbi:hypothetical protein RU96_GL001126 [Enterococcus canintestini]|uniref:Uncharacterized protein n=1 Tax=Enterococcus canintestini TaxID=317010 RepID=A0A1L8R9H5_9ENTE|nr:hypothetical protein RU96_GL001126 [Enterococcus canintestini]
MCISKTDCDKIKKLLDVNRNYFFNTIYLQKGSDKIFVTAFLAGNFL